MSNYIYPFRLDVSAFLEIPVDITTFIESDKFLGKYTKNGSLLYPFWKKELERQYSANLLKTCFATARGAGNTFASMILSTYRLYQIMCMKNPNNLFQENKNDQIYFVFASVGAEDVAQIKSTLYRMISNSEWLMSHGTFVNHEYIPEGNIRLRFVYKEMQFLGMNIVGLHFQWSCDKYSGRSTSYLWNALYERLSRGLSVKEVCVTIDMDSLSRYKGHYFWQDNIISGSLWDVKPPGTFEMNQFFGIITDRIIGHSQIVEFTPNTHFDIPENGEMIIVPHCLIQCAKIDLDNFLMACCGIYLRSQ